MTDLELRQKHMKEKVEQAKLAIKSARLGIQTFQRTMAGVRVASKTVWGKQKIKELSSYIVYVFMQGSTVLYIGKSSNGLHRPFNPDHAQAKHLRSICDKLEIYACSSNNDALKLENHLIRVYRPPFNSKIGPCHM